MKISARTMKFFSTVALMALVACSSQELKPSCETNDWYELGRRDGSNGKPEEDFANHTGLCLGNVEERFKSQYISGRNAGLVSYCTSSNGWYVGRNGQGYFNVCPKDQEANFLKNYNVGLRVYSLEKQNVRISREIDVISNRLRIERLDIGQKFRLTARLEELRSDKEGNSEKMSFIRNSLTFQ